MISQKALSSSIIVCVDPSIAARNPCPFVQILQFLLVRGRSGGRKSLDHQSLDLVLESADLAHEVGSLVCGDGSGDDGAGDTAGATESHLGRNVDVTVREN